METIGEKIKLLRIKQKLTQDFMADKLGVSVGTYSRYETGDIEAPRKRIERICEVLGIKINSLFEENNVVNDQIEHYQPKQDLHQEIIRLQNELINCQKLLLQKHKNE